jgi:hypothetical protein
MPKLWIGSLVRWRSKRHRHNSGGRWPVWSFRVGAVRPGCSWGSRWWHDCFVTRCGPQCTPCGQTLHNELTGKTLSSLKAYTGSGRSFCTATLLVSRDSSNRSLKTRSSAQFRPSLTGSICIARLGAEQSNPYVLVGNMLPAKAEPDNWPENTDHHRMRLTDCDLKLSARDDSRDPVLRCEQFCRRKFHFHGPPEKIEKDTDPLFRRQ